MARTFHRAWARLWKFSFLTGLTITMAGCEDGKTFNLFKPKDKAGITAPVAGGRAGKTVERDVEAPKVFEATDKGLWDGRPSLGGVWVAHPDVADPERVIIRNKANGKSVVGALFRRERENPGPKIQVSSDAAEALGMLAGQPAELYVVALRREEVKVEPDPAEAAPEQTLDAPEAIEEKPLDPIASAAAAIDAAEGKPDAAKPAAAKPAAAPAPAAKPASNLGKPYIQIGIFSVEANANKTADMMRNAGMVPVVKKQSSSGKTFWRVLVGPSGTKSERSALLKKVKGLGFADAYFVTK